MQSAKRKKNMYIENRNHYSFLEDNLQINFRETFAVSFSNYSLVNTRIFFIMFLDIFKYHVILTKSDLVHLHG